MDGGDLSLALEQPLALEKLQRILVEDLKFHLTCSKSMGTQDIHVVIVSSVGGNKEKIGWEENHREEDDQEGNNSSDD
ncbi:hypothetical protein Tco_0986689 [Tanacetum coccineum]